jgi:hypothetical protein
LGSFFLAIDWSIVRRKLLKSKPIRARALLLIGRRQALS